MWEREREKGEGEGINGWIRQLPKLVEFMMNNSITDLQFGSSWKIRHYGLNGLPSYKASLSLFLSPSHSHSPSLTYTHTAWLRFLMWDMYIILCTIETVYCCVQCILATGCTSCVFQLGKVTHTQNNKTNGCSNGIHLIHTRDSFSFTTQALANFLTPLAVLWTKSMPELGAESSSCERFMTPDDLRRSPCFSSPSCARWPMECACCAYVRECMYVCVWVNKDKEHATYWYLVQMWVLPPPFSVFLTHALNHSTEAVSDSTTSLVFIHLLPCPGTQRTDS